MGEAMEGFQRERPWLSQTRPTCFSRVYESATSPREVA